MLYICIFSNKFDLNQAIPVSHILFPITIVNVVIGLAAQVETHFKLCSPSRPLPEYEKCFKFCKKIIWILFCWPHHHSLIQKARPF
jgi:hypothetical protein